ncbi:MAG TPA: hypothetical protein VLK56_11085 [Solirubrobacterales bacterium]|nr:hypothetical protein [Solirubrobacterales bacterium]
MQGDSAKASNRRMLRIGIVALALIVGVVAWLVTRGDGGGSNPAPASASAGLEAKIVSPEELGELALSAGHAVYWAGLLPGKELEASETAEGDVQVRYLDEGTEAGGGGAGVLTIGSYPMADPVAAMEGFAKRDGAIVRHSGEGREAVTSVEKPTSVYFAAADNSVQVEVYDPSYKRAMSLALSPRVQPVG